jgi:hypothetical protein
LVRIPNLNFVGADRDSPLACRPGPEQDVFRYGFSSNIQLGAEAVAGKNKKLLFGSKSSRWRELFTLLDFVSFFANYKIWKQIMGTHTHTVGIFSMLPDPPKYHIRPKIIKSTISAIKLQIP